MYDDQSTDTVNNQPGDSPMLDTPVSTDPAATDAMSTTDGGQSGNEQFTPSPMDGSNGASDDLSASRPDDLVNPSSADTDELLTIKQQALQQLTPLVDHLNQSPKEEFRTTMMMIQATDNQTLVKKAFDAAQKIDDDKERAQAFLDIINEINYFTQHHE